MIRFLDLKGQIHLGGETTEFAFYDTVSDTILSFYGEQVFSSLSGFTYHFEKDGPTTKTRRIERFLGLIPEGYFDPPQKYGGGAEVTQYYIITVRHSLEGSFYTQFSTDPLGSLLYEREHEPRGTWSLVMCQEVSKEYYDKYKGEL